MNKYLAGYIFGQETLFNIQTKGSVVHNESVITEPLAAAIASPKVTEIIEPQKSTVSSKKLVLVVNSMSDSERELLSKILLAAKQNLETAEIIDMTNSSIPKLSDYPLAKEVISFGVAMSKLGNSRLLFPYQTQVDANNVKYLLIDDLNAIATNLKDEKKLLWVALKNFYGI